MEKAKNLVTQLREQVQNEAITLDNDVDTTQRGLDALQAQNKENELVAPIDGVVLNLYANPGEYLPPQTQLCRIGSAANKIVASVNEEDIGYLKPGMKAEIQLYAYRIRNSPARFCPWVALPLIKLIRFHSAWMIPPRACCPA